MRPASPWSWPSRPSWSPWRGTGPSLPSSAPPLRRPNSALAPMSWRWWNWDCPPRVTTPGTLTACWNPKPVKDSANGRTTGKSRPPDTWTAPACRNCWRRAGRRRSRRRRRAAGTSWRPRRSGSPRNAGAHGRSSWRNRPASPPPGVRWSSVWRRRPAGPKKSGWRKRPAGRWTGSRRKPVWPRRLAGRRRRVWRRKPAERWTGSRRRPAKRSRPGWRRRPARQSRNVWRRRPAGPRPSGLRNGIGDRPNSWTQRGDGPKSGSPTPNCCSPQEAIWPGPPAT